ncbi:MAG: PKD domain-containing protein [Thermoplasmata archaeon]
MKGIFGKLGKSRGLSVFIILLMIFSSFAVLGSISSATTVPPYTISFNEAKLPTGTTWGIILSNSTKTITATNTTISSGGSISESLYNGTYYFNVTGTPWWFNSTHGKFTVAGATQTITINFIENFTTTFKESGLPTGTTWGISSSLGTYTNKTISSGGSIVLKEANSTTSYAFTIIGTPWWFNSTTINVEFNANKTYTINFIENFTLTVKENGLLSGITWTAGVGIIFGQQPLGSKTTIYAFSYVSSFTTNSSSGVIKYHGSTEFSIDTLYGYKPSFLNMVTIPANKTILGSPLYYSNITFNANATLIVNFTPLFHVVTVEGYVNPNGTNISSLNFMNLVNSQGQNSIGNIVVSGFYKITTTQFANLLFYKTGYSPKVVRISSTQSVQWINVTLQKMSITFNMSQIMSIKNYNNQSWIYNFNLSKAPVNFSYVENGVYFTRMSQNELLVFANLSGLPPFPGQAVLEHGQPIPPPLIINVTFKLNPNQKYMFLVFTNASSNPIKFFVNASSNGYTTIDLNKYTDNFTLDPLVQYSMPQAVITTPSVVAYDSAVVISGTNSIASANATITNWTWKITGPQNQLYTEYGKTITQYFSITGIYTISLTVTDSNGLQNSTTTSINVVSANQDLKIKITYSLTIMSNGYYEYNVTVDAQDNVSISQFLASVDGTYVNVTLTKQIGYVYYYGVKFNPNSFGYGNHTIKFEAINSLDGYNSVITYATFGSVNEGGILAYLFGHIALTIVILIFIVILITFVYVAYKDRLVKKIRNSRRIKGSRRK